MTGLYISDPDEQVVAILLTVTSLASRYLLATPCRSCPILRWLDLRGKPCS